MMPSRILRTRALTSRRLGEVSAGAEALYYRLMLVADDYGRFHGDPALVQSACYPRGERQIGTAFKELVEAELVYLYEHEGETYLLFDVWDQQARTKSKFPDPPTLVRKLHASASNLPTDDQQLSEPFVVGFGVEGTSKSAPKEKVETQPSDIQTYLFERLREHNERWAKVPWSVIVKFNGSFGRPTVTTALQRLWEEAQQNISPPENPVAILQAICKEIA
jgi:hypothetical protein